MCIGILKKQYEVRRERLLEPLALSLCHYLIENIDYPRVDRICCRAKSTSSFMTKAHKLDESGKRKYNDPINEIQDQVGARIVTFYKSDVERIRDAVLGFCRSIEHKHHIPPTDNQFGYEGVHFILLLPRELITPTLENENLPRVFELQIKTLFQHAWSEAEHDLAYKGGFDLTREQQRKIAFTAAQAWGADQIFDELFQEAKKDT